ncbi:DUF2971 domain-containing protein [Brachyspira aalborgi]|uniref:DUF2971 domain-containing protein n=1 Tax=Brachyspira aalborgi TaxID=29522 RepID=A0A5C8CIR9_9SPIR|nr:DUF2971 domain-containing protein [Brachyspira aalborgi]TXJ12907.1 DUF2971 domain-containing protein [Brachyspira aalborgi]
MRKDELLNKLRNALEENKSEDINEAIKSLYDLKLYKDTAICLENAINSGIKNNNIYFQLGTIYGQIGDYSKSEEYFKENIKENNDWRAYMNLAMNYIHSGKIEKAIETLNDAVELPIIKNFVSSPSSYICNTELDIYVSALFYNRAKLFMQINEIDKAYSDLLQISAIDTGNFLIPLVMANIHIIKNEHKHAIDYINKSIGLVDNFLKNNKENNNIKYQYFSEFHLLYLGAMKSEDENFKNFVKSNFNSIFEKLIKKSIKSYIIDFNGDIKNNSLFYYTRYNEGYTKETIIEEYLYLSDPTNFNDPIDPIIRYIDDGASKDILNKIRIACLTTTPYDILMWGHYGDKSEGICIEYDISNLLNDRQDDIVLTKIKYSDYLEYNECNLYFEYKTNDNDIKKPLQLLDAFSIKHREWSYENEYRIIRYNKNEKLQLPIKAVYLGEKMNKENRIKLIEILKEKNIHYYDIKHKNKNIFELESKY